MTKRLVSVFGARLTGKTTVSEQLAERMPGARRLECNRPDTWDNKEWYLEVSTRASSATSEETMWRHVEEVYKEAGRLLLDHHTVILDGDSAMKSMAQIVLKTPGNHEIWDVYGAKLRDATQFIVAQSVPDVTRKYILATVSRGGHLDYGMQLVQDARSQGGSIEDMAQRISDAKQHLDIYDNVATLLESEETSVLHLPTDIPYDADRLARHMLA